MLHHTGLREVAIANHATRHAQSWLQAPGSLTARLRQLGVTEIVLVRQGTQRLWPAEHSDVGASAGHVREVVITVDGVAAVWARSVTTQQALHGSWKALANLGTRPLADLLFHSRMIDRGQLRAVKLPRHGVLEGHLRPMWFALQESSPVRGAPQWGRSSVFVRKRQPLRVFEAFAPWVLCTPLPQRRDP
jgi:chorismate--pyruvate lyase